LDPLIVHFGQNIGCSNLYNFYYENGPFDFSNTDMNQTLKLNPYSWNLKANVLYIDGPGGSGFSYASPEELKILTDS